MTSDFRPKTFNRTLRWRRLVITIAVLAVGLVLWVRHQRLEAYRTEIIASVEALMIEIENGIPAWDDDGRLRLILQQAHFELGRLWSPVDFGPVELGEDGAAEASIVLTGEFGGRVRLRWQGAPPVLVGVDRLGRDPGFDQSTEDMAR